MSRKRLQSIAWVALLLAPGLAAAAEMTPRERLATALLRTVDVLLEPRPLEVEVIEAALMLVKESVELDPDDPGAWRTALQMSLMAEDDQLTAAAIKRLVTLDPEDDRVRLLRLTAAVDRYQTVDERIKAYEKLLAQPVERLGAQVASRLALDLALLHQRDGNLEAYGRWLGEATAIDPSNPAAAAMAAGFFMKSVDDPYGEAELLVNAFLANPNDAPTQLALGRLLMENGAYAAAARIFDTAIATNGLRRL